MGWIGPKDQLLHVLATFGADRDEERRFLVGPPGAIVFGLDGDVVVSDDAFYVSAGAKSNLCGALGSTSYGLRVHVV